jgi:hypothetical protein
MKDHAKVGNRAGRPGYRTPSVFRYQKSLAAYAAKIKINKKYET